MMETKNIFSGIPDSAKEEIFETIVGSDNIRIERIISTGQSSRPDFWYDQEESEFVILLSGSATIMFDNGTVDLLPGDYINIPAHRRHRVEKTDEKHSTAWLAVFYK